MTVEPTPLAGLMRIQTRSFADDRGRFTESWNARRYADAGLDAAFVQDNLSVSRQGVLRGLHFQDPFPQGKLVSVLVGTVWDVAVDIRPLSSTFGKWYGCELSCENGLQLFVPPGFAHGFVVLSASATFFYKCTEVYRPDCERSIRWNDPALAIEWPVKSPLLSPKDATAQGFDEWAAG